MRCAQHYLAGCSADAAASSRGARPCVYVSQVQILEVAVLPQFRRRGFATLLLSTVLEPRSVSSTITLSPGGMSACTVVLQSQGCGGHTGICFADSVTALAHLPGWKCVPAMLVLWHRVGVHSVAKRCSSVLTSGADAGCPLAAAAAGDRGSSASSDPGGCSSHSNMLSSMFTACMALSPALSCTAKCCGHFGHGSLL